MNTYDDRPDPDTIQSKRLLVRAESLRCEEVLNITKDLLENGKFENWSGSDQAFKHHYGHRGLIIHTNEVIDLGLTCRVSLGLTAEIDPIEYYLAGLFHDAGKVYDYTHVMGSKYTEWEKTPHKRLIHHISRSALIWSNMVGMYPVLNDKYHDTVLHAILAHHGHREWGSPVAPKTRVAWLLHLCDGISARMNDCEKIDQLKVDQTK